MSQRERGAPILLSLPPHSVSRITLTQSQLEAINLDGMYLAMRACFSFGRDVLKE